MILFMLGPLISWYSGSSSRIDCTSLGVSRSLYAAKWFKFNKSSCCATELAAVSGTGSKSILLLAFHEV